MDNISAVAEKVASSLLQENVVKVNLENPFTWTSGLRSPIYCDNRLMISHVDTRKVVLDGFVELIKDLEFDYLAGTATAGIPWAAFLAERLQVPMVYVRSAPKGHGAGKQVEGDHELLRGKRVLIVEDLISTGGSVINTAEALRKELEADEIEIVSIFTYKLVIAKEKFASAGLSYRSLTDFPTLLRVSDFSEEEQAKILKFTENPAEWFDSL